MRNPRSAVLSGLILIALAMVGFAAFTPIREHEVTMTAEPQQILSGRAAAAVFSTPMKEPSFASTRLSILQGIDPQVPRATIVTETTTTTTVPATTTSTSSTTTAPTKTTQPVEASSTTTTAAPTTTSTTTTTSSTTTTTSSTTTTTTIPPPTTEPTDDRYSGKEAVERWRPLVAEYFPAHLVEDALRVIDCESNGDPNAVNPRSGAAGLFQFLPSTWSNVSPMAGWAGADVFDPRANIAVAAWLVNYTTEKGLGPWQQWNCKP